MIDITSKLVLSKLRRSYKNWIWRWIPGYMVYGIHWYTCAMLRQSCRPKWPIDTVWSSYSGRNLLFFKSIMDGITLARNPSPTQNLSNCFKSAKRILTCPISHPNVKISSQSNSTHHLPTCLSVLCFYPWRSPFEWSIGKQLSRFLQFVCLGLY